MIVSMVCFPHNQVLSILSRTKFKVERTFYLESTDKRHIYPLCHEWFRTEKKKKKYFREENKLV